MARRSTRSERSRRAVLALAATVALLGAPSGATAQPAPPARAERSLAINAGLIQPLALGGANLELDLRLGHLVVAYSHGWSLELDRALGDEMTRQRVTLHVPYTTGVGVGAGVALPRLRSLVDVRVEAKVHRLVASYASEDGRQRTRIADYRTYTLGGGVYWTIVPFASTRGSLRGLNLSTSLRLWPNVATSLPHDRVVYANATTGRDEVHRAARIGIANTPWIVNLSVGYRFD